MCPTVLWIYSRPHNAYNSAQTVDLIFHVYYFIKQHCLIIHASSIFIIGSSEIQILMIFIVMLPINVSVAYTYWPLPLGNI